MRAGERLIDRVAPGTPVAEAARLALNDRLTTLANLISRSSKSTAGSASAPRRVHQLRVAIRRADAAIGAFDDLLGRKAVRSMRRRLRRLRRAAGHVRDLDVGIEMLEAAAADEAVRGAEAAAIRHLLEHAAAGRASMVPRLRRALERSDRDRISRGLEKLIDGIDATAAGGIGLETFARRVLRRHSEELRAAAEADLADIDGIHELRLVLKRLRYALEVFGACFESQARRMIYRELLMLQERLGTINDLAIMSDRIAACVDDAAFPVDRGSDLAAGLRRLALRFGKRLDAERRALVEAWTAGDPRAPGSRGFVDRFESMLRPAAPPAFESVEPKVPPELRHDHEYRAHLNGTGSQLRPNRRVAAIDVGTNSLRLIVAEAASDGSYRVLDDEKEVTRLGRGLHATGRLDPAAIEHSVVAIDHMKAIAEGYGATQIRIVGTAAARAASNRDELCRAVLERTGLPLEIISAEKEAMLAYRSAARAFDLRSTVAAVVDIGGGSTEIVLSVGRDSGDTAGRSQQSVPGVAGMIERVFTIPIGAVDLTERFAGVSDDGRLSGSAYRKMRKFARRLIREHIGRAPVTPQVVIGTGGTLTTLGTMALNRDLGTPDANLFAGVVQGYEVPRAEVRHLLEYLRKLPVKERTKVPGLSADRADIIVGGLIIVDAVLRQLGVNRVRVHDGGIRDGMLLSMIQPSGSGGPSGPSEHADPMASVHRLARACAYEEAHSLHVARLALSIFDQLQPQVLSAVEDANFEPARLRQMLEAAAVLHDIGYLINYASHHKHSYHLIVHADLPGWTSREVQIIACVARYHRCAAPKKRHRDYGVLSRPDRAVVRTLAGILRIADGLDRTHIQRVAAVATRIVQGAVQFEVTSLDEPGVDLWGAARKSRLFQRSLGLIAHFEWRAPEQVEHPRGAVSRDRPTSSDREPAAVARDA